MASIALRKKSQLLIPKSQKTLFISSRFYSSSSSSSSSSNNDGNSPEKPFNFSSYFTNNKPKFNQQQQQSSSSIEQIQKNLSEFRRRTSESPHSGNLNSNSFRNLNPKGGVVSIDKIRESLQKMKDNKVNINQGSKEQFSLNSYKESFRMSPPIEKGSFNKSGVMGGSNSNLPFKTFGKEIMEKGGIFDNGESNFSLNRSYSYAELGQKLKELRPNTLSTMLVGKKGKVKVKVKGKEGEVEEEEGKFSLSELQQRLGKLKEVENAKSAARAGENTINLTSVFRDMKLQKDNYMNRHKVEKLELLGSKTTPKEHLIEKYFHPDNMSSAEKLKIELKKVRDEFKTSESDCGSTQVQIAQLTTEIHHLSSVLQKKDKHSLHGLKAKVQKRKKLLKYLRRTDFDSYCFVLSKLGLRDNPDYKN